MQIRAACMKCMPWLRHVSNSKYGLHRNVPDYPSFFAPLHDKQQGKQKNQSNKFVNYLSSYISRNKKEKSQTSSATIRQYPFRVVYYQDLLNSVY